MVKTDISRQSLNLPRSDSTIKNLVLISTDMNRALAHMADGAVSIELSQKTVTALVDLLRTHTSQTKSDVPELKKQKSLTKVKGLTFSEVRVLECVASGFTNKEIAGLLHLSPRTVESYRYTVGKKLGITNPAKLTRYAIENGIVSL